MPERVRTTYWYIAAATLAVDQLSKYLARNLLETSYATPLIGRYFRLTLVRNPGAAFGLFPGGRLFFIVVALAVTVGLIVYARLVAEATLWNAIALGLGIGGSVGNLVDRLFFGSVTDFLDLRYWPVFNLADAAILVGLTMLVLSAARQKAT